MTPSPAPGRASPRPKAPARARAIRALKWGLAVLTLVFVVRAVPVRDRCQDPRPSRAAVAGLFPLSRPRPWSAAHACTLQVPGGPLPLSEDACARLTCERGVASVLGAARAFPLLGLLALYLAGTLAWSARWRVLLALAGVRTPLGTAWRITLESQAGGVLLPGGLGGDALRIAFALRQRVAAPGDPRAALPPTASVVASVLLDRVVGLVSLTALASAGIGTLASEALRGAVGSTVQVLEAIPLAFALGLALAQLARRHRWGDAGGRDVPGFAAGALRQARLLLAYVGARGALWAVAQAFFLSLLVSFVQLAVVRGLLSALGGAAGVGVDEAWVLLGTTLTFLVGVLPALPGGWGTTDAAFVFFLGHAGVAPSHALAVSLVYRLFWYASAAAGAVLLLVRGRAKVA